MPGPRSPRVVHLTDEVQATLRHWTRRTTGAAGLARRAHIVLLAAEGVPVRTIATRVGVDRNVVRTWLDRFRHQGLDGLQERPRPGRPRAFSL
jgi:transposase